MSELTDAPGDIECALIVARSRGYNSVPHNLEEENICLQVDLGLCKWCSASVEYVSLGFTGFQHGAVSSNQRMSTFVQILRVSSLGQSAPVVSACHKGIGLIAVACINDIQAL